ncbi:uncharacterized protein LOC105198069 [Solenopsis invicta]|uniref:uncharacterized protein LOC105198069 n=1 Tax=Solenopsis invicta TaxID=13686 RepID=UPI00193CE56E|nr:uncharacterized protein LOC105198069 [Solenopsis invicta]XP_025995904.2 uncharacterized protein LOC105198069 [Solenopsis invicta]XP_039304069.1 uncharacterized protein LOC105198069 [Solenopsis invicta]
MDGVDKTGPQNSREITFPYRRLRYEDIIQYPYIDKLSIPGWNTKDNRVSIDFIYQFAIKSFSYSCDNSEKHCSCYVAGIMGPPTFCLSDECSKRKSKVEKPTYRESNTYPPIISRALIDLDRSPLTVDSKKTYCIRLEYHKAVYPLRISIFSDSNSASIIKRIWAKDSDDKWSLLWDESIHYKDSYSNMNTNYRPINSFSILRSGTFKTKVLRLEYACPLQNLTLSAVMLTGTSDFILPRRLEPSSPSCLFDLLDKINPCLCRPIQQYEFALNIIAVERKNILQWKGPTIYFNFTENVVHSNLWDYYDICESEIVESFHKCAVSHKHISQEIIPDHAQCFIQIYKHCTSYENYLNYEKFLEDIKLLWEESKKPITCSFSELPDKIIVKILRDLDLKSLGRISRVNKRLNNLSQDPELYKSLNIRNILYTHWRSNIDDIFLYFAPICKYLTQLDLSFCTFSAPVFNMFLATRGQLLTNLVLNYCPFIDDSVVLQISKICKNLKGLDLKSCNLIRDDGLSRLQNLKSLERFHLAHVRDIKVKTLCKILQRNRQMRDLNLTRLHGVLNVDEVAMTLKTFCSNLENIDLRETFLTSQGIDALADCKNLREITFINMWSDAKNTTNVRNSFYRLFSSCQRLEKIDLSFNDALTNRELETLTLCKSLKCLKLLGILKVLPNVCFEIFLQCPKLKEICLHPFVVVHLIDQWNKKYQDVTIFTSYYECKVF